MAMNAFIGSENVLVSLNSSPLLFLLVFMLPSSLAQRVETSQGPVIGQRTYSTDLRYNASITYDSFYSLPFASPPLGKDRFARPKPPMSWTDPRNATKEGAPVPFDRDCYQVGGGDEDCLYLAVHVPVLEDSNHEPLPVMVWLTGGAFLVGGGSWYGPHFWMTHEIILVTINYRLGPLGFITLGMEEAPGNAGLWDQRAALEWVQDNIAAFGGDAGRVTLAGESAGSFSAFYHLASAPSAKPLFHRIIGQSGVGGLSPSYHHWSPEEGVRLGNEVSVLVGCVDLNSKERLDCLRNVSAWDLARADFENGVISLPVADAAWSSEPFFPKSPEEAFLDGDFDTTVDVLLGSNQHEGLLITQLFLAWPQLFGIMMSTWQVWGPLLLLQKKPLSATNEDHAIANLLLDKYTDGLGTNITIEQLPIITDLMTDAFFNYGIERYIGFHLAYSSGRLFQYADVHLNDYSQLNWAKWVFGEPSSLPGISHGDELWLQWWNLQLSERDQAMSRLITKTWANFVKLGDPTPPGSDYYWEEVDLEGRQYFEMAEGTGKMVTSEDWRRRADIWREAFGE